MKENNMKRLIIVIGVLFMASIANAISSIPNTPSTPTEQGAPANFNKAEAAAKIKALEEKRRRGRQEIEEAKARAERQIEESRAKAAQQQPNN